MHPQSHHRRVLRVGTRACGLQARWTGPSNRPTINQRFLPDPAARTQAPLRSIPGRRPGLARTRKEGTPPAPCIAVEGTTLLIFFITSAHDWRTQGVVRQTAGHLVALNWTIEEQFYNVRSRRRFLAASDDGLESWATLYLLWPAACMATRPSCSKASPWARLDAGTFWRVISETQCAQLLYHAPPPRSAPSNAKTPRAKRSEKIRHFVPACAFICRGTG